MPLSTFRSVSVFSNSLFVFVFVSSMVLFFTLSSKLLISISILLFATFFSVISIPVAIIYSMFPFLSANAVFDHSISIFFLSLVSQQFVEVLGKSPDARCVKTSLTRSISSGSIKIFHSSLFYTSAKVQPVKYSDALLNRSIRPSQSSTRITASTTSWISFAKFELLMESLFIG